MGNIPCCCAQKDDDPKIEVKVKDVYCCDNIQSSCCMRGIASKTSGIKTEKKHHHHKHHSKHPTKE
jgi:hypothetical protein